MSSNIGFSNTTTRFSGGPKLPKGGANRLKTEPDSGASGDEWVVVKRSTPKIKNESTSPIAESSTAQTKKEKSPTPEIKQEEAQDLGKFFYVDPNGKVRSNQHTSWIQNKQNRFHHPKNTSLQLYVDTENHAKVNETIAGNNIDSPGVTFSRSGTPTNTNSGAGGFYTYVDADGKQQTGRGQ